MKHTGTAYTNFPASKFVLTMPFYLKIAILYGEILGTLAKLLQRSILYPIFLLENLTPLSTPNSYNCISPAKHYGCSNGREKKLTDTRYGFAIILYY
jgi:hypothetical protein